MPPDGLSYLPHCTVNVNNSMLSISHEFHCFHFKQAAGAWQQSLYALLLMVTSRRVDPSHHAASC